MRARQEQAQRPTFRAGAHFVRVDVYPAGTDRRILRHLTADDFEVFEDGRPQQIETFDFSEFLPWTPENERRDPNSVQEAFRLAEDPRYRVFVFYYDVYHVEFMSSRRLETPLAATLERMLGPGDLFGLITPRQSPDELTLGQRTFGILRQLETILTANTVGADLFEPEDQALFVCYPWLSEEQQRALVAARRLEKVYTDLETLVSRLGALRQERKNLVVFASTLTGPRLDPGVLVRPTPSVPRVGVGSTGRLGTNPQDVPGTPDRRWCDEQAGRLVEFDVRQRRRDLALAALRANVAIYTVSPAGLGGENVGERGYDLMSDHTNSLLELSNETDAIAVVGTNDLDAGLGRIVEDVSAYYTLGYYTDNTKWDGGVRRIEVRLKATGRKVRARREYRAPTEAEMASMSAAMEAASSVDVRDPTRDALAELARLEVAPSIFVRAVPAGSRLRVAVELPTGQAIGSWGDGAAVAVDVVSVDQEEESAAGRIEAGLRGALVELAAPGSGPWTVAVEARAGRETRRERITADRPGVQLPAPSLFRAAASLRAPLQPAAEPLFRRTERVHLEWYPRAVVGAVTARLLNSRGQVLPVSIAVSRSPADGPAMLIVDVSLAPLAAADYVIELAATIGTNEEKSLFAFRVVR